MKIRKATPQRGQVLVIFALSCVVMVGMVALAVDAGLGFADARGEQNASDAAALTGSQAITAPSGSASYSSSKARMEAMVSLARNLGFMAQLGSITCNGTLLTPNYTTTPASYNTDIDLPNCTGSGSGGLTIGAYTVAIYQPPQSGSHTGDAHAIEVRLTHKVATSFARVLGISQLIGARSAVAGSEYSRWVLLTLKRFAAGTPALTMNTGVAIINGDVGDNSGATQGPGSTLAWYKCSSSYAGGDPASSAFCSSASDENFYKSPSASVSLTQSPSNTIYNLPANVQDPNYPSPAGTWTTPTSPDCIFQPGGSQAANYNPVTGVLTLPPETPGEVFSIPPGAYTAIDAAFEAQGTIILQVAPTAAGSCAAGTSNADKTPGYFLLGAPGQTTGALLLNGSDAFLIGNGVFLQFQPPTSSSSMSNQFFTNDDAKVYINAPTDINGYVGPGCVGTSGGCAPVQSSPWGTKGSSGGVALGDPISVWISYLQGATPASPGSGSTVINFDLESQCNILGILYAPDDNIVIGAGDEDKNSSLGRVIAYTATYGGDDDDDPGPKVIHYYSSAATPLIRLYS